MAGARVRGRRGAHEALGTDDGELSRVGRLAPVECTADSWPDHNSRVAVPAALIARTLPLNRRESSKSQNETIKASPLHLSSLPDFPQWTFSYVLAADRVRAENRDPEMTPNAFNCHQYIDALFKWDIN